MPTTTTETIRNGVPVDRFFGAIGKVEELPELGRFRFTAVNDWIEGFASRSRISEWHGLGAPQERPVSYVFAADHPTLGTGHGPTPQEYVLHALASCISAGIATTAAARRIELTEVRITVHGTQDLRGALAIDPAVRNGYEGVEVEVHVVGDAAPEELEGLVDSSAARSAVLDMLSAPTPVSIVTTT